MGEKSTSTCQSSSSVSRRKNQRARSPTTYPHGSGRRQTHKRSKCPDSSSGKEERGRLEEELVCSQRPSPLHLQSCQRQSCHRHQACSWLVFLLTHPGQESIVFCSENDNLAEKWMTALREA